MFAIHESWLVWVSTITLLISIVSSFNGLRWELEESDGYKVRILTDSKNVLTLISNADDHLIQCHHSKEWKNQDAVSFMYYATVAGKDRIPKQALDINLDKVYKSCQKYMDSILFNRTKSRDDGLRTLKREIESYDDLIEGIDGTKWCGMVPRGKKTKQKIALKREDRCCKHWHECKLSINGFEYNHELWNHRPYAVHGCNCTLELKTCLSEVDTEIAREVLEVQFEQITPKCLILDTKMTKCVGWDKFYSKCSEYEEIYHAKLITLAQYQPEEPVVDSREIPSEDYVTEPSGPSGEEIEPSSEDQQGGTQQSRSEEL